jgi:hypothetical protein
MSDYNYKTAVKPTQERRAKEVGEASESAEGRARVGTTAGAGLGSLAAKVRKRPPMPMLSDFGGDSKAHGEALRRWRTMGEESNESVAQKRVLGK